MGEVRAAPADRPAPQAGGAGAGEGRPVQPERMMAEQRDEGWTVSTLHHVMDRLFRELEQRLSQRFEDYDRRYEDRFRNIEEQFKGIAASVTIAFSSQEKAVNAALAAAERAVGKAEVATEKRLEGMNEFRSTLSDQAALLMPRKEAEERLFAIAERLQKIENMQAKQGGGREQAVSSNQAAMWATGILVAIGLAIAAIVASFIKH